MRHCALTNCWAKDSWKLEISTAMSTASQSLWHNRISNDLINYLRAVPKPGIAPRGNQERQIQEMLDDIKEGDA